MEEVMANELNFESDKSIAPVSYTFEDVNHFVSCETPTYEDMQALCLGMSKHIETLTKGIKCINKIIVESEGVDCFELPTSSSKHDNFATWGQLEEHGFMGDYEAALKLVMVDLEE